jgi:hypothetical protein
MNDTEIPVKEPQDADPHEAEACEQRRADYWHCCPRCHPQRRELD